MTTPTRAARKPATKPKKKSRPAAKARPKAARTKGPAPAARKASRTPKRAARPVTGATNEPHLRALANAKAFFDRTLSGLEEADSAFAPVDAMFTAAQQVAHVAQTVDWFLEGAFRSSGFDTDFPAMERRVRAVTSLAKAKAWLEEAFGRVARALREQAPAAWEQRIPADTIMGGAPRSAIVSGIADHTAHHRGALAVYIRLRGRTPAMPYM